MTTTYIGTKIINAWPMDRGAYNVYRGWTLPANENPEDAGFLVEYLDGGKPNDLRHDGYISWSPKDVFEKAYRPTEGMDFGDALRALKAGHRVARAGWNGKGMWLAYSPGVKALPADKFWAGPSREFAAAQPDGAADVLPCVTMKTATGEILMGWLASQTDMLSNDWVVL